MITTYFLILDKHVISTREDYILSGSEDDCLLSNSMWKDSRSIAFVEGKVPLILTCNDHDGGTKIYVIHTCRWKHNLPSKLPDQLCQTVIKPRMLKPVKAYTYSTSFQIFQDIGTFNGIDTCSNTSFGNFDFHLS